jgi:hypothetical protein
MAESEYKPLSPEQLAQGIRLDSISEMGSSVPVGRYKVKLSRVEAKDSKQAIQMVIAGFDVIDGTPSDPDNDIENIKGLETSAFYSMYVGKSEKSGRTIAPGIMEFKASAAAVGKPLADDYIFPGNVKEAARLVHDTFHPKSVGELEAVVIEEPDRKDKTKKRLKTRIIGRWGASGTVSIGGATAPSESTLSVV